MRIKNKPYSKNKPLESVTLINCIGQDLITFYSCTCNLLHCTNIPVQTCGKSSFKPQQTCFPSSFINSSS